MRPLGFRFVLINEPNHKGMTEIKWLNFSGLMRRCIYDCQHEACPFNEFRKMDQIQQFLSLEQMSEKQGEQLLSHCEQFRVGSLMLEKSA